MRRFVRGLVALALATAVTVGSAPAAHAAGNTVTAVSSSTLLYTEGPYFIHNYNTQRCVDIPGYGAGTVDGPVNQYDCAYDAWADNQKFYIDWFPLGRFMMRNATDGLCLDLPGYGTVAEGTKISEYYCQPDDAADNQMFYQEEVYYGVYRFRHSKTGMCLDVDGFGTGGNDARLGLYTCSLVAPYDDHLWNFVA